MSKRRKRDKRDGPKAVYDPHPTKRPATGPGADLADSPRPLGWRFAQMERNGPYSWGNCDDATLGRVIRKLADLEGMTWAQLAHQGSHALTSISAAAEQRLSYLQKDDFGESLFSVRLDGLERVICIRIGGFLDLLWWDPNHLVCPSALKNT